MTAKRDVPPQPRAPARKPEEAIDSERKAREETRREERRPTEEGDEKDAVPHDSRDP